MALLRLGVVWLMCAGAGYAGTIVATGLHLPLGEQATLWINEQGANSQLYWAGGIDAIVDGHPRLLWCVQLFVTMTLNTTYNTAVDFADTPALQRVGWMIGNLAGGVTNPVQGAAFQLAIWDVMEDNGDGLAVGAGKVYQSTSSAHPTDPAVLAAAAQYEAASVGQSYPWIAIYHNTTPSSGTPVQTLAGPLANDGALSATPEPRDLALVVGGLVLIVAGRWRRRPKPPTAPAPAASSLCAARVRWGGALPRLPRDSRWALQRATPAARRA